MLAVEREAVTTPCDWTAPQNNALWRDAAKTLFDPCPAGWRVPQSGTEERSLWRSFTLDNATRNDPYPGNEAGFYWKSPQCNGGAAWYPPTGWRGQLAINSTGASAHYLSATAANSIGYALYFNQTQILPFYTISRNAGHSVRCIRE